ncbi:MAG: NAD(P)-dependent glycerol-3-phosphate dehydrogenase [Lachnospiraceae bacterium]|nr:NAD(P)-dependent glycerol-3-phosphate dehydrogenase [Lachnospiraceae bacterium]
MANITVLGAGSWGGALAALLCDNGHRVMLWSHKKEQAEEMQRTRKSDKLKDFTFPESLSFAWDLREAVLGADLLILAVPSTATRETAEKLKDICPEEIAIVSVSKGIEESTLMTQSQIIEEILPKAKIAALSGPSHAEEVIRHLPTVVVAGSKNRKLAIMVQEFFMNENFRVYISSDLQGIEVGASLKNVIALAAGMSDGLGNGDNTRAALITRGIREITALAVATGGNPQTLSGLAGIGDLIVTCQSVHSRNHKAGELIGQGVDPKEAMEQVHMVVEGVYSAKAALALGKKYHMDLPIISEVNKVLFEGKSARIAMYDLMNRDKKTEMEAVGWNS